jgi:hypothetical protein
MVRECGAKARTNKSQSCRRIAMANGRCHLHGGKSTGPRTEEGRKRMKEANTKHGFYTIEARQERCKLRAFIKAAKTIL